MPIKIQHRNEALRRLVFFVSCLMTVSSVLAKDHIFFRQTSFADTQSLPVIAVFKKWDVTLGDGDYSQTYNQAEIGWHWKSFEVSLLHRLDFVAQYSNETIQFIQQTKKSDAVLNTQNYNLDLNVFFARSNGLRFAYKNKATHLGINYHIGVSLLQALFLIDGKLTGQAVYHSEQDYSFDFSVDYYYSKDYLFSRQINKPSGYGITTDIRLSKQFSERIEVQLSLIDLFGVIRWENTPRTQANADSSKKMFDDQGRQKFEPVLKGIEKSETFLQTLPRRISLDVLYQVHPRLKVLFEWFKTDVRNYFPVGLAFSLNSNVSATPSPVLKFEHEPFVRFWRLGIETQQLSVSLLFDKLTPHKIHTAGGTFSIKIPI